MQFVTFYEKNADRLEPVREKMEVENTMVRWIGLTFMP